MYFNASFECIASDRAQLTELDERTMSFGSTAGLNP
jgi:hypothetical protein